MNPARIPTQAEHAAMQRLNTAYYATQQASRFDLRQRTPIFTCAAPARVQPAVSETRVNVYFLIAAALIFAARYVGVFA
jgi:hypothetical protein